MGACTSRPCADIDAKGGVGKNDMVSKEPKIVEEPTDKEEDFPLIEIRKPARRQTLASKPSGSFSDLDFGSKQGATKKGLQDALMDAASLLATRQDEGQLTRGELKAAHTVYDELLRVLSVATRTGNYYSCESSVRRATDFRTQYDELMLEFDKADQAMAKAQALPAATRHLTAANLCQVNDFMILDNSLRETTVGAPRGHTLQEKHQIMDAIADTGLTEIILGSFGSKIAVDSQIAQRWRQLGKSFDNTWGFSEVFDMEAFDEEPIWTQTESFADHHDQLRSTEVEFHTPPANPVFKYSKEEKNLVLKASEGFDKKAFNGMSITKVLKTSENPQKGQPRIPLGLIMLAGHGIKNAIIEIDTSLETLDYQKFDIVDRCKFLIAWCKENLPKRTNVPEGQDPTARVIVNLRDFTNLERSKGGLEECLRLVDALSRLPPQERPFGFAMEEPTNYIFPDKVGRLCRMVRLTMNRAGFPQGRFLVHSHWYFGLGECTQLTALANGCDGVWAAVCKAGAQTGHACSTVTAVNLVRAGQTEIAQKYNLPKMCEAARIVTKLSTRQPCPTHEEVYGELAFDIPYIMTNLPACRYNLALFLKHLNIETRMVRINELSMCSTIHRAMESMFGPPEKAGWNPKYVPLMHTAIFEHLMTGLSRDYNSPLGLGHLYGLVSETQLSQHMISIMAKESPISDYHPTVLEFIHRWNRLCAAYEGEEVPPHEQEASKSTMVWNTNVTVKPRRIEIPFRFFISDVVKNSVIDPMPQIFKSSVVRLLTQNEQKIQRTKKEPMMNFHETILRLKLFIQEADSLGVLPIVDDFCLRKNHDFFFGEDVLWLANVRGNRPKVVNNILRVHIDMLPNFYAKKGNNAVVRCVRSAAKRIDLDAGIREDLSKEMRRASAVHALKTAMVCDLESEHMSEASYSETLSEVEMNKLETMWDEESAGLPTGFLTESLRKPPAFDSVSTASRKSRRRRSSVAELLPAEYLDTVKEYEDPGPEVPETEEEEREAANRAYRASMMASTAQSMALMDMQHEELSALAEEYSSSDEEEEADLVEPF